MKPSMSPKVIENPNEFNLTDEYLSDFMVVYREHIRKTTLQKNNYTNFTNSLLENHDIHQAANCDDYCDSHRQIFDDYKQYHGYVTLVVSVLKFN